ncbi:MAG: MOSC domain-containing protein [Pseudomonadales bacterium]|nr:MOSC domain-containing protein [Pseudomonadales bacterium]
MSFSVSALSISALYRFPVKSMGGQSLASAQIDRFGIQYDRRWMLVDDRGKFITQRQCADMVRFSVDIKSDGLTLTYQPLQGEAISQQVGLACFNESHAADVLVWRDTCRALVASDDLNAWISDCLQRACRLVYMPDSTKRRVDETYAKAGETVSFADGFPLLLTTDASLAAFNQTLSSPIEMLRFRPNIVVAGAEAWAEDQWRAIKIGELVFEVVKPCSRCVIPTINRDTIKKEPEVFQALRKYRQRDGEVYFGQNLLPQGQGKIKVGDKVELVP